MHRLVVEDAPLPSSHPHLLQYCTEYTFHGMAVSNGPSWSGVIVKMHQDAFRLLLLLYTTVSPQTPAISGGRIPDAV
jgi:hypothetical protein